MDRLSDYDYHLPDEAIAQTPLEDRSGSKLLHIDRATGDIHHRQFRDVLDILEPGDLLVLNDTRVTALRLFGAKATGGKVEFLLLSEVREGEFEALAKPGKRLQPGTVIEFEEGLRAEVLQNLTEGRKLIRFEASPRWREKLQEQGQVPLPPYIYERLKNPERYQTVFATNAGSAAAPTAGLHFTKEILSDLRTKGVKIAYVTLNVGIDTFRPVMAENLADHHMHGEVCMVSEETAKAVAECKGRVIAVGTTAVRTLESFATGRRQIESGSKLTSIFIRPGYEFKVVDGMFTNFHMPRTTMLIMLSALTPRELLLQSYGVALREGYRFLSFGDSMLIL